MRNVHPRKRPILETVNSKVEEQLIGRRALFETLQPVVQCRTCRVRIALGFAAVFGEGEAVASVYDPVCCPE